MEVFYIGIIKREQKHFKIHFKIIYEHKNEKKKKIKSQFSVLSIIFIE